MPLNVRVFDPAVRQVGNTAVIGANNQPYREEIFTTFPYSINSSDYSAGSLQFITVVQLQLQLNNASRWIQFRDGNPPEYELGTYSLNTSSGLLDRGDISSLSQIITVPSRIITLDQNEAARPKLISLSSRPRLVLSKSVQEGMDLNGAVRVGLFGVQIAGTVTGTTIGVIAATGTGVGSAAPNPNIVFPRRQFIMDSTDGRMDFTFDTFNEASRFPVRYDNLGDIIQLRSVGIFLRPGITGTLKLTVFKAGDTNNTLTNPNPIHVPVGLPAV